MASPRSDKTLSRMLLSPRANKSVISDKNVTQILRQAVINAYPDQNHICRKNISNFRTHSIIVFACCTLIAAGLSDSQVEYGGHLRGKLISENRHER